MAMVFETAGNYRGALEQYQDAMRSQKDTGIRFNYYWQPSDVRYRLKIVEMMQKLGRTDEALANLSEALDVRRKATEIDQANPRSKEDHAYIFYSAGKIFAAAGKFQEALVAYREAESYWTPGLGVNNEYERLLGKLYLGMGDLFATGRGMRFQKPSRSQDALSWYQKSAAIYTELQNRDLADAADREGLQLAQEKIRLVGKN
jgi:tetratricopeptide (TPR) repeat protein